VIASLRRRFVQRVRRWVRAFALEAAFFGVLMFGSNKVPRWFYLMSCFMVAALLVLGHGQQSADSV
jgi:hypothetical protein